jgi:ubiquinol-cytochrome c reductase cytochrome c1 subunit
MKKLAGSFLLFFALNQLGFAEAKIALEKAPTDIYDVASIKRGAKIFATTCMACHTLVYMRYNKLAQEAGVRYDRMPLNVKQWPLNVTPPDLSLEVSVRGADWIYTYLHSFYMDPARPTGVNNVLVPNTAMSAILVPLQGQQKLVPDAKLAEQMFDHQLQWYDVLELQSQGSMTPQQFDAMVTDVVNFLAYSAEPYQAEQRSLGWWVVGFLLVFFVLAYLLKKEYWKDVNKHK